MGPLPFGPASKHLLTSKGPDYNHTRFYVTEYSINHGMEDFSPKPGKPVGTGYKSNFRPGIYYNRKLDEIDNPEMGNTLAENYTSSNKLHFHSPKSSGNVDFPNNRNVFKSGFVRDVPKTLPSFERVRNACYDPTYHSKNSKAPRSLLYHVKIKDPIEQENDYFGPALLSTENDARFVGQTNQRMDTSKKSVGPKEGSGFTHAYNHEPITYRPTECFDGTQSVKHNWRPTGYSVMKKSFQPCNYVDGKESFRILSKRAERDTGYSREIKANPAYIECANETYTKLDDLHPSRHRIIKKNDPAEYLNMIYASKYPSTTRATFQGLQMNSVNEEGNAKVLGRKEESGFTENNCQFVDQPELPDRFDTHYKLRFYDKNPTTCAILKMSYRLLPQLSNGFTKSTKVHGERSATTRQLHPYVARSIAARDPYYVQNEAAETSVSRF